MRRGFNMLMAIFMLLLLAGLSVVTLKFVRIHAKQYVDSYNKEQAQLFMQSVVEATLMRIHGYRRNGDCLRTISFLSPDQRFEANVTIEKYYVFDKSANNMQNCPIAQEITTPQSNGYVLMSVVVSSTDDAKIGRPIRMTKRTLQRP